MMKRDAGEHHPSMRYGLKPVVDGFEALAETNPGAMIYNPYRLGADGYTRDYDVFGDLAVGASYAFMAQVDEYLTKHKNNISSPTELLELRGRFNTSSLGIGVIAVFSEVAPLVYMRDMPDAELTPASAAELTANSYDFIQRILNAGGRVGAALAHAYVVSKSPEDAHSGFGGTIRANRLAEPDRLARFGLVADAQPARVEAVDIDEFTNVWNSEAVELGLENKVNCPAEIYKDPDTSERFARRIFKIMLGYTEAHIYPRYLPIVKGVLEQERSRELARENT